MVFDAFDSSTRNLRRGDGRATGERLNDSGTKGEMYDTLGKTRIQKTRDFLDQSFEESVVHLCEILHKLLQPKRRDEGMVGIF